MTQVDFYVMTGGNIDDSLRVACRLAEKASQRGTLYIHTADEQQSLALNEKLWSFRDDAFTPHELFSNENGEGAPKEKIVIGHTLPPESFHDIMINLSLEVPNFHGRFERLLEVVPGEHEAREACRKSYAFYRDRGYPLKKHDIQP